MASTRKKNSAKGPSEAEVAGKIAVKVTGLAMPDFDSQEADRVLSEAVSRLRATSRRASELAGKLETLAIGGSVAGLPLAQSPGDVAEDVRALTTEIAKGVPSLERLTDTLQRWVLGERRSRRSRFEEIARRHSWNVVGTWPEPVIEGIVFVKVDEGRDRAWVNGRPLQGNPTAERLVVFASQELDDLLNRRAAPQDFVADAWAAFNQAAVPPGQGLDVYRLLREMLWLKQSKGFRADPREETFRPYSASQFRADLTHYLASGSPPFKEAGRSHHLDAVGGSFAQDAIFMYFPQTGRLASCGRLSFRAVEPGGER